MGHELRQQAEEEDRRLRVERVGQEALAQGASELPGSGPPRPVVRRSLLALPAPAAQRVQRADPEVEHVRAAEQLDGAEEDRQGHQDGGESRDRERRVHQQPAGDAERGGQAGGAGGQGVAYDDGEIGAGQRDHAGGDPGEGDQLCVHGSTLDLRSL